MSLTDSRLPYQNKVTLLVFILAISLASPLGFAATINYNDVYGVFEITNIPSDLLKDNCYDIDIMVNYNMSLSFDRNNFSIDCGNSDADIKCKGDTGFQGCGFQVVNDLKITPDSYYEVDSLDAYGKIWVDDTIAVASTIGGMSHIGVTSEGRYYKINGNTYGGEPTWCDSVDIRLKNITGLPYFNFTNSKDYFSDVLMGSQSVADSDIVYYDMLDAGYSIYALFDTNASWEYYRPLLIYNVLTMHGNTERCIIGSSDQDVNDLGNASYSDCDVWSGGIWELMNVPPSVYSVVAFNHSGMTNQNYDNYSYMTIKMISNTRALKQWYYALYQSDYFTMYDISYQPITPQANTTVRMYWKTTQAADSKLWWRSAPSYNISNFSAWANVNNSVSEYDHNLNISGYYILEGRYYEWFVQSNKTGTIRTSGTYNFSSAGSGVPFSGDDTPWENDTGIGPTDYMNQMTENLATNLGATQQDMTYMFAALILVIFIMASVWFTGNPIVAVAVFLTGIVVFSLFGWLPPYLFIIVALVFAFILVMLFKGMLD